MWMKFIYKTWILLLTFSMVTTGCKSLNEEIFSEFEVNNFFETIDQLQSQSMGMYLPFSRANTWEFHFITMTTMQGRYTMTADAVMKNASIYGIDHTFASLATVWECAYQSINRANTIIANAHRVNGDQELINNHIAEARFMRAWNYYVLVSLFGDVPLRTEVTQSVDDACLPRTSVETIYEWIVADLKYAVEWLPVVWSTTKAGRVTQKAAITLLGKVYLTMAGYPLQKTEYYQKAAEVLEDIAVRPDKYDCGLLEDIEDVYDVNNKNNKELLFVISSAREGAMSWATALHYYFSGPKSFGIMTGQAPGCSVGWKVSFSKELYDMYDDNDDRKTKIWAYSYVGSDGVKITYNVDKDYRATGRGIVLRKYVDTEATGNVLGLNDRIIYRYAETLLLAAEAYANTDQLIRGLFLLNKIRARAHAPLYQESDAPDKETLLELIYKERAMELCGEFYELFDLRRLNKVEENFMNHNNRGSMSYDPKFELYPIPSREILYNPAITENNPGW